MKNVTPLRGTFPFYGPEDRLSTGGKLFPQKAVVTGASSGIGATTARALAAAGFDVAVGYGSNALAAQALVAELERDFGVRAVPVRFTLDDPDAVADQLGTAVDALGGLGVLVNNGGVNHREYVIDESPASVARVTAIDYLSPFALATAAVRVLVEQGAGGRIINITSVHEHIPISGGAAYCAAKAALGALTKVLALEHGKDGITVNAVAPGETATPMNGVPEGVDAADLHRPVMPVSRPGRTEEVAGLVTYLASPNAAYITGSSIVVDGGLNLIAADANVASVLGPEAVSAGRVRG